MNITLISPYPDITAFGMRTMSAYLKKHGHKTQLIFLPDLHVDDPMYKSQRYEDNILDEVVGMCKGTDLIGIGLMTNFFDGAKQITAKLKSRLDLPVIWGGVHPTIRPEESLEYADMVCIGDGEDAMLDLADKISRGEDYSNTANLWLKQNNEIVKNPARLLVENLDVYPLPDYSREDHYIIHDGHMKPMTHEITKLSIERGNPASRMLKKTCYQTMTGRGCPHKCSYCINDFIKGLYKGQRYLRWRSVEHVIEELFWAKNNMPYINYVLISDDVFLSRHVQDIEKFSRLYKAKIALPFSCLLSPLSVSEEKMDLLVDAGLVDVQMGLESGSRKIQELFNRKSMTNERMMEAIKIINKYKDKFFPPRYDFIIDVPYETDEDKIENLKFISKIPKPFHLQPFSLVLYPETNLYKMAKRDGFITDENSQIYTKAYSMREPSYLNLLMMLAMSGKMPSLLMRFLISKPAIGVLNRGVMKLAFKYLFIFLKGAYRLFKK